MKLCQSCIVILLLVKVQSLTQDLFQRVQNEILFEINQDSDTEVDILKKFSSALKIIQDFENDLDLKLNIDSIIEVIAQHHEFDEYFAQPWQQLKQCKNDIWIFFNYFKEYAEQTVFVDEVVINDFIESNGAKENLLKMHEIWAPKNKSQAVPYKLYLELLIQVFFQ